MKTQLFSAALIGFCFAALVSCHTTKHTTSEIVRHDSTVVTHQVHIDTFRVPVDHFTDSISLSALEQIGSATFRGDRTTTRVIYRDGQVIVDTKGDSLYALIMNRLDTMYQSSVLRERSAQVTEKEKSSTGWIWYSLVFIAGCAAGHYISKFISKISNNG